jgi:Prealbumin-like fold domain
MMHSTRNMENAYAEKGKIISYATIQQQISTVLPKSPPSEIEIIIANMSEIVTQENPNNKPATSIIDLIDGIRETGGHGKLISFVNDLAKKIAKNNQGSHSEALDLVTKTSQSLRHAIGNQLGHSPDPVSAFPGLVLRQIISPDAQKVTDDIAERLYLVTGIEKSSFQEILQQIVLSTTNTGGIDKGDKIIDYLKRVDAQGGNEQLFYSLTQLASQQAFGNIGALNLAIDFVSDQMAAGADASVLLTQISLQQAQINLPEPPSGKATLAIIVEVVNDNGGTATPNDFTIGVLGGGVTGGLNPFRGLAGSGGTYMPVYRYLNPGTYSVTETMIPAEYMPSYSPDCSGSIAAGNIKTCIITNNDRPSVSANY